MKRFTVIVFALIVFVMGTGVLAAQDPVVGAKDPESLFTSKDPRLNTNKQATMHNLKLKKRFLRSHSFTHHFALAT